MFGNILGRDKKEPETAESTHSEVIAKIDKMNLTDMRAYLKNNMTGFESCSDGLIEVMNKLLTKNEDTLKRYIELDDMDIKKKKGFELVITISEHKKITVRSIEQIQEFIDFYKDVIEKFDTDNKQIYASKLRNAIENGMKTVELMTKVDREAKVLAE